MEPFSKCSGILKTPIAVIKPGGTAEAAISGVIKTIDIITTRALLPIDE